MADSTDAAVQGGLTEEEKRHNVISLAFHGREDLYEQFCKEIEQVVPPDTTVILRGSAVTGCRWKDSAPFDADGPGTSDLDLTLVGGTVLDYYLPEGFYIAGIHSKPLSDKDPEIAPRLLPLRRRLMSMVGRPVDIQGTRDWVMFVREYLMGQPYLTLIGKLEQP